MVTANEMPRTRRAGAGDDVVWVGRRLFEDGLTDGLPIVPPTEGRVTSMLGSVPPDHLLVALPPLYRAATAEDLAVCAVLAGCEPGHFPFLLAALDAVTAPEFNLLGVVTTTGSVAIGLVLHGPQATRVGANDGGNCLGPGNLTNAAVGRGVALAIRAISGAVPGVLDMATLGQPAKYGMCLAEAASPRPWSHMHADRGMDASASAVTVVAASGAVEIADPYSDSAEGLLATVASALPLPAALNSDGSLLGGGEQLVVFPPEWAHRLSRESWTKGQVQEYLYEHSTVTLDRLPVAARDHVSASVEERGVIASASSAGGIQVVVAGGPGTKGIYLPSWPGGSCMVTRQLDQQG